MQASEASTEAIGIGAGPLGLFAVVELGLARLKAVRLGFHAVVLIAPTAYRYVRSDKGAAFQYTTSSSGLRRRLKVA